MQRFGISSFNMQQLLAAHKIFFAADLYATQHPRRLCTSSTRTVKLVESALKILI